MLWGTHGVDLPIKQYLAEDIGRETDLRNLWPTLSTLIRYAAVRADRMKKHTKDEPRLAEQSPFAKQDKPLLGKPLRSGSGTARLPPPFRTCGNPW
ncbi:MAG: hypothetical protein AABZ67_09465 [Pseudomonadota bacterium]